MARHGFEPNNQGVKAFGRAVGAHKYDVVIQQLLSELQSRMLPSIAEAKRGFGMRRIRKEMGIRLHELEHTGTMCWTCDAFELEPNRPADRLNRNIPEVEGAFVVESVLSVTECEQIIRLTEAMGFKRNVSVALGSSIRKNENVLWWTGDQVMRQVFERVKPHLPRTVHGQSLIGLNQRFRVYKYQHGDAFLPHYDESWEGVPSGGQEDEVWRSQLSILIYLNELDSGQTHFFKLISEVPQPEPDESFESYERRLRAVVQLLHAESPAAGSALCFFHGSHQLNALHSGRSVKSVQMRRRLRACACCACHKCCAYVLCIRAVRCGVVRCGAVWCGAVRCGAPAPRRAIPQRAVPCRAAPHRAAPRSTAPDRCT